MTFRTLAKSTAALGMIAAAAFMPVTVMAQDEEIPSAEADEEPERPAPRTRIGLGPQLTPSYPGSDRFSISPLIDFSRADAGEEFAFEAPDESFGFPLYTGGGFSIGPSAGLRGKRDSEELDGLLPDVGFSVELGGYAQFAVSDTIRIRGEARQAVSGHDGFISILSADYVRRDGDDTVLSIGPRLTITDKTYQNAYFGVTPTDAVISGLPAYDADGGIQAVGGTIGLIQQFTPRWGMYGYAKYDRLVNDAADSPVVLAFGSRDQFSGGVALTYTFGSGVD